MCGTAGIFKLNGPTMPESIVTVQWMMDARVHCGTDGSGMYEVIELMGSSSKLVFCSLPDDDPMQCWPDISLARQKLGWEPKISLREGIRHAIAQFDELLSVPR